MISKESQEPRWSSFPLLLSQGPPRGRCQKMMQLEWQAAKLKAGRHSLKVVHNTVNEPIV